MTSFNKNLIFYFLVGVVLEITGVLSIWIKSSLVSLVMVLLGIALFVSGGIQLIRFFLPKVHHHGDFNSILRSILSIIASIILIWYQGIPQWLMVVLFGCYMLLYATACMVQWWLYREDRVRGRLLLFFTALTLYVVGGIFLLSPQLTMDDMLILFGIYFILLGLTYFRDGFDSLSSKTRNRMTRKIRITLPAIVCAVIPAKTLNDINAYLKENEEFEEDDYQEAGNPDLEVYVHVTDNGFGLLGHVDIGFEGMIISYGNYDTESYRLNSIIGDGVFFLSPIASTVENYLSVEKNNLFVYGLRLTEEQKADIRQAINRIIEKGYRWLTKIERENGFSHPKDYQEDYPSRLVYKTGAKFYKFREGRFKTYFALGSNCVLLADSIIGRLGTDVLSMRGLITPGTYLDYLDKEYHKKGSIVITRQFYPCHESGKENRVLESIHHR
ncbi:DUF308 domain-containing protein [Merdibacter massiliensis]|uniref:DUF308 domain-containing protein n=1 Tax=Merdibacter massiliensis TaxID=1871030 RepID=UPI00096A76FA|nr:DUF308 domain-containing protein [Merdibacter massiliensis]